jgi:NADPH2:quinone reductase
MKAIRVHKFGDPKVMVLEDVPDPKPEAGQVLVRVKAVGVNPVDTYVRTGIPGRMPPLPYTPGSDAAGTVEAVGSGVTGVKSGGRVYTLRTVSGQYIGGYAELAVCEPWMVKPLPDNVSFSQGAAINVPYGTAYRALIQRAHAVAGDTLLVHGASGGVGIAAVQLGRAHGLTVIGTAGTDRGRKLVEEQGAHHVLDHRAPDYLKQVMDLTGGQGVDVILEMLSNVNLGKDLPVLAKFGRVVVIGARGTVEINPRDAMMLDAAILGMSYWNASDREMAGVHAGLVAGLANATLRPVVGQEMPLKDAPRAHEAVMEPGAYGKIVLIP